MSKSLGNFFTVRDIAEKYDLLAVRLFMLSAHYRNPVNFSQDLIAQAEAGLKRLENCLENLRFVEQAGQTREMPPIDLAAYRDRFIQAMDDDLNTADALGVIFDFVKECNTLFQEGGDLSLIHIFAVEELGLTPVSRPENVDILSREPDQPMMVTAELYTKPEVNLGKYMGVSVEVPAQKSAEELLEEEIEKVREQNARFVDVDRAAAQGDKVVIDYSGSIDGEKFEGGTAEGQTLDLGSGTFIEGFEEQIVGMKPQETKTIEVTFPEKYHAKELAGKPAQFEVKLNSVKEKSLPELRCV